MRHPFRLPWGWRVVDEARPSRLEAVLAGLVGLALVALITRGHYAASGDAVHYMMIARSIAVGGDLDLGDDYGAPSNILDTPAGDHARPGRGGVLRPVHGIGLPVLSAPLFAVAYALADASDRLPQSLRRRARLDRFIALRQLVSLLMIALTARLAVLVFRAAWSATGEKAGAWLWALVVSLSPPVVTHGYVFLTELPSALVALAVFVRRADAVASPARAAVLGLLTGLLMHLHVRNVGLVAGLVAVTLWMPRGDRKRTWPYLAGLAVAAGLWMAVNAWFWGSLVTTPHARLGEWPSMTTFWTDVVERIAGMLFDARHGLLVTAPVFLAAPAAWLLFWRRSSRTAAAALVVVIAYLALVAMPVTNVHGWRGGWSPAARFLLPVIPLLALPFPLLLADARARWLLWPLMGLQLPLSLYLLRRPMLTWSEGPGPSPVVDALFGPAAASRLPQVEALGTSGLLVATGAIALWLFVSWLVARKPA